MSESYDFSGYATKNDLKCSDGRTIRKDAFKDCDGKIVPLVWQHVHNDPTNVLGHALLENREDGVYCYCTLNDTEKGANAKELIKHGDINALSIYANKLVQKGGDVLHGAIREVSLVLVGANPGAFIDNLIMAHSDGSSTELEDEAVIYSPCDSIEHSCIKKEKEESEEKEMACESKTLEHEAPVNAEPTNEAPASDKTIGEIIETMNEEQKQALYALVGMATEAKTEVSHSDEENGGNEMYNVFENNEGNEMKHSELDFGSIVQEARRCGSMKDAVLAHADENTATYGIDNIGYYKPEVQAVNKTPEFIKRVPDEWVEKVLTKVHRSPFSRIKSLAADITADAARAKGYVTGNQKANEVIAALKRTTTPTTIYKLQKLDRDDIIDITDFDVVAWIKGEMRMMLDEEIARGILCGDGRSSSSDDKINEQNLRPIYGDVDPFTIYKRIAITAGMTNKQQADLIAEGALRARETYQGKGTPTCFCTTETLDTLLLAQDLNGHRVYKDVADVAAALRCESVIEVPVMKNLSRTVTESGVSKTYDCDCIIVNLADYNVGADKGGAVALFDDFDIDYNQQKYLIETRISGALINPKSAIIVEHEHIS